MDLSDAFGPPCRQAAGGDTSVVLQSPWQELPGRSEQPPMLRRAAAVAACARARDGARELIGPLAILPPRLRPGSGGSRGTAGTTYGVCSVVPRRILMVPAAWKANLTCAPAGHFTSAPAFSD